MSKVWFWTTVPPDGDDDQTSALSVTANVTPTSGSEPLDVTFSATVTGGKPAYLYQLQRSDGTNWVTYSASSSYDVTLADGTHTWRYVVTDADGTEVSDEVSITVTNTVDALTATVTVADATIEAGGDATFDSTVSGGTGPYTYSYRKWDGSAWTQVATTADPAITFSAAGTFYMQLWVTDAVPKTIKIPAPTITVQNAAGSYPWKQLPVRSATEWTAYVAAGKTLATVGGEGIQYTRSIWWDTGASFIVASHDSGQMAYSEDAGVSWRRPSMEGVMGTRGCVVAYDPSNTDILIGVFESPTDKKKDGIYRSTNKGRTWTLRQRIHQDTSTFQVNYAHTRRTLTYAPGTSGTSRVWWVAIPNGLTSGQVGNTYVWKSTDNGVTWTAGWNTNTCGQIVHLLAVNSDVLFMGTSTGFYKSTDGGTTFVKTGVGTGLPSSNTKRIRSLQFGDTIGATTSRLFAVVDNGNVEIGSADPLGLYKSTDSGANWTKVGTMALEGLASAWPNPLNDDRIVCIGSTKSQWTDDGGATWTDCATTLKGKLYEAISPNVRHSNRFQTEVCWSPTSEDVAVAMSKSVMWRSTDGGETWVDDPVLWGGLNVLRAPGGYAFDPDDADLWAFAAVDVGLAISDNGGQSFTLYQGDPPASTTEDAGQNWNYGRAAARRGSSIYWCDEAGRLHRRKAGTWSVIFNDDNVEADPGTKLDYTFDVADLSLGTQTSTALDTWLKHCPRVIKTHLTAGGGVAAGRVTVVADPADASKRVLAFNHPLVPDATYGQLSTQYGAHLYFEFDSMFTDLNMSWRMRFGNGFEFNPWPGAPNPSGPYPNHGGKLPGLHPSISGLVRPLDTGTVYSDCPTQQKTEGGTSRIMWMRGPESGGGLYQGQGNMKRSMLHLYSYNADHNICGTGGEFGLYYGAQNGTTPVLLEDDTWYTMHLRHTMNTPGTQNGRVQMWIQGGTFTTKTKVLDVTTLRWLTQWDVVNGQPAYGIRWGSIAEHFGGATKDWLHKRAETIYFDDVRVWED